MQVKFTTKSGKEVTGEVVASGWFSVDQREEAHKIDFGGPAYAIVEISRCEKAMGD